MKFDMIRADFVLMLSEFYLPIINADSDLDVTVTSRSGWKMKLDFDIASSGGLIGIDWIESPDGERIESENMDDWHSGCVDGFVAAVAKSDREVRR